MSHPFGDLLSQYLHRKHGLSQSKLAEGILQAPTIISSMCKGRRLTGPQARDRVVAILGWLHQQGVLATRAEANALLAAAGMADLQVEHPAEAILLHALPPAVANGEGDSTPDASRSNGTATTPLTAKSKKVAHLPAQLTPLMGRAAEMSKVAALIADLSVRLLTLYGPGGIGKTRLALEVAATQVERFDHGVYFVSLAAVDTAYAIVPQIADILDFSFYSEGTPLQQLCDYLHHKRLLLILDNFEHLIGDVASAGAPELDSIALLLELLQAAPQIKILVTSRQRLNVQGEQLYLLDGIDFPASDKLTLLAARRSSAVALFVQSAQRVQPAFELTPENVAEVCRICRLVQGMPLAILLTAAWASVLTPAEILAKLVPQDVAHESLDFLETEWRDVPARQRSLRAVFDHSWRLMGADEQTLFAQLSVFRNGFTRQGVEAILYSIENPYSQVAKMLRALLDKSLIRRRLEPVGSGRYDLHELVRQYAAERLAQTPDRGEAVRVRHSRFYCALLGAQEARLNGPEQLAALTAIELELDNALTAWRGAVDRLQIEQLAQAMQSLGFFFEWRNRYVEGEAIYSYAVRRLQGIKERSPAAQRVLVLATIWQGVFCRLLRRFVEGSQLLQQVLAVLESSSLTESERQPIRAFLVLQLGRLYEAQLIAVESNAYYRQALALYKMLGDQWGEANALLGLGAIAYRKGDFEEARGYFEASLAHYRSLGYDRGSADVLERLNYIFSDQGNFEMAQKYTAESVALYEKLEDRAKIAQGQLASGWLFIYQGRLQDAYDIVSKCEAVFEELGLMPTLISPTSVLAIANIEMGHYDKVRSQVSAHLEVARRAGNRNEVAFGLLLLSFVAIAEKRYADAEVLAIESGAFAKENNDSERVALAICCQGLAMRGLGRPDEAWRHFTSALKIAVDHQSIVVLNGALPGIALLFADQGEGERAVELYAPISDMLIVAHSKMRWDTAGAEIAAAASALPPEVAEAARARGRAANVWETAASLVARNN